MDSTTNHHSPSSTTSSSATTTPHPTTTTTKTTTTTTSDPMQTWWESISKARTRIQSLTTLLPRPDPTISSSSFSLSSLAESERPALSFLSSHDAYILLSSSLCSPTSGSGSDPLCHWLYDTFLTSDPDLRLLVLSYIPLISGLYLSRIHSNDSSTSGPSLAGFEAVLLAIYSSEVKSRHGKAVTVQIPDLSQPSLYHSPARVDKSGFRGKESVGVMCPPLEPQVAVKSTKRGVIVGVGFDCYFKQIGSMPSWSKVELCRFVSRWTGHDCPCKDVLSAGDEVDELVVEVGEMGVAENGVNGGCLEETEGARIPLPWEMLQPLLRILGHCLLGPLNSQDVKDTASVAVRRLYARASHDLAPQAILATRSLIRLDKRAREAASSAAVAVAAAAATNGSSNSNTPSKAKKPEIFLVSK